MSNSGAPRGMPLLSSPAPPAQGVNESNCKRCNKEFNIIFTRARRCNHCGYAYCSNCCDHQALCRRGGQYTGYDALAVCAYCIEMLSITASGRTQLRSMSISKLRGYLNSYNIKPPDNIVEKDDLVDAILNARGDNGCLSLEQEAYYRRETIPKRAQVEARSRNPFTRSHQSTRSSSPPPPRPPPRPTPQSAPTSNSYAHAHASAGAAPIPPPRPPSFPQPQPYQQSHPQYRPPPGPPPHSYGQNQNQGRTAPPPRPPPPPRSPPQNEGLRPPQPPPRPRSVPPEMPSSESRPPPQPVRQTRPSHAAPPPLSALLETPKENIAKMSVSLLKGILDANHVNARLILEKSELVDKVWNLIEVERRERERERIIHEREEEEVIRRQQEMLEAFRRQQAEREAAASGTSTSGVAEDKKEESEEKKEETKPAPPKPTATFSLDRDGLCVVCQDEEANIAIVDCGHLALCMGCSETIMKSTKECPLCRTRIVTEQRLLRIFRT